MSKFITNIPIDVEAIVKEFPAGRIIHRIEYVQAPTGEHSVAIFWEHDHMKTPFTYPIELSRKQVAGVDHLPANVRYIKPTAPAGVVPAAEPPAKGKPVKGKSK